MFGWRKRDQGFEWRTYVRTTILVRRQQRKEKLEEAKGAAVAGLKQAGRKGMEAGSSGLSAAGSLMAAGVERGRAGLGAGWRGLKAGLGAGLHAAGEGSGRLWRAAGGRLGPAVDALAQALVPARELLGAPRVVMSLAVVAAVAGLAGAGRAMIHGPDFWALLVLAVAGICALLLAIGRADVVERVLAAERMPDRVRRIPGVVVAGGLAALVLLGGGAWWMTSGASRPGATAHGKAQAIPASNAKGTIAGRAIVHSGDALRVGGASVRLAGIEAPHPQQTCTKGSGRRWKCGEAAAQALKGLVRGKTVVCEIASRDEAGRSVAGCRAGGVDIAAELVKGGHVFAERSLFSRYGSLEREASAAKAGLWSGEAERPADWRAKRWDEAKRSAPEGCPIKALVSSEGRVYVLPWSRTYDRVKVRSARGERWFCSEAEALAAGWRPTDKS